MKKQKRINWMDTLRGIGMFCVIWSHTFPKKWLIRKYIVSFHMPLFFFMNGLTYKERDISIKDYTKKLAKSLLLPYFIISLILYILNYTFNYFGIISGFDPLENFIGTFFAYNSAYNHPFDAGWYLCALFLTEILFFTLKKITKDDKELSYFIGILGIIGYLDSISGYKIKYPWHINTVPTSIVFCFLGYIFKKHINKLEEILNTKPKLFITGFTLGVIGLITGLKNGNVSLYSNVYSSILLFYISSLSTTLGLICFVKLFMKKSYFFKKIGEYSLFYLAYHPIFIKVIAHFVPTFDYSILTTFLATAYISITLFPLAHLSYKKTPILIGKTK